MNGPDFDQLARTVSPAHDRRTSLKALGVAALGAALASPLKAEAKKRGKKGGNKRKKQCDKEKKQCRRVARDFCQEANSSDPAECKALLFPCCRTCKSQTTLRCVLDIISSDD